MKHPTLLIVRKARGLSNLDMAELLEISKGNYSKKENGYVRFSLEEAKKLADLFDMSIEELFFSEPTEKHEKKIS